jgi:hypothetical protein
MNSVPEKVNEVLKEYFNLFEYKLPDLIEDYYIYGSVSLGAFDYGFSDIDFIAVVKRKVTNTELNILKEIHRNIKRKFPKTDLMGLYVMKNDLQFENENEKTCPCFINAVYKGLVKFEKDSIDAYQLKKYGITIKGQEIEKYNFTVNWDNLIKNMRNNLNTYWLNWMNACKKFMSIRYISSFFSVRMIEWGVLGVTRLYYTFKERDIISKVGAGEYALKIVPQRWHKIIKESMRLRKDNKKSYYKSIFERRKDALEYIEYIIQESNRLFISNIKT